MFENSVTKVGGADTLKFRPIPQFGIIHFSTFMSVSPLSILVKNLSNIMYH